VYANPLIITVAPNGAYKQTSDHPAVPISCASIAATAKTCLDAGASMLHLHIRDNQGRHSLDVQTYRDTLAAVRAAVGGNMVLQVTSEAAKVYQAPAQMAMVRELRPEAVSVGLRELDQAEVGEVGLAAFFSWLKAERVMTQVILYDAADVLRWNVLRRRGVIPQAPWFLLFVLGRYTVGQTSNPRDLLPFLQIHEAAEPWAVCAFGATEHACVTAAAALGGHVRVGFENNLKLKSDAIAPDNAALVRQATEAAACLGRPVATADDVRQLFTAD
jgi:3-keto-5-aminohexanoate cleavage enzyme